LGSLPPSGQSAVGLVIAVGVAYFLAAWLGVALRPQVGLCIYCPAAGVAVGALILFGPNARMPIATSVAITTVASSIMFGKSPWEAAAFGLVNAGQALFTTWLFERWFGDDLKLKAVPQVLGFLVASAIGVAIGATGAAIAKTLAEPIAFHYAWQVCFGACLLGTLTFAPLLIGLGELPRELPPRRELIEGTIAIVILALLSVLLIFLPQKPWDSALPVAFVLPVLLWLAVRCRPVFGAAAASVLAVTIFWSTASHTGHFGDASIPLADRILAAQTYATAGTLLTLILSALFDERRSREALLKAGNEQLRTQRGLLAKERAMLARLQEVGSRLWLKRDLREALDEILAGAIELLGADKGIIRILDPTRGVLEIEAHRGFKQEFLDFFREVSVGGASPLGSALRSGKRMVIADVEAEELFKPFGPLARSAGFRAVQVIPIMSRKGELLGTLATHFHAGREAAEQDLRLLDVYVRQAADIIERHKAEDALRESEERLRERDAQLALAGRAALVGNYTYDVNKGTSQVSGGYAAIHGLPEGTTETTVSEWRARVHPDDLEQADGVRDQAFAERHREDKAEYRIVLPTGEVRWIERRGSISYGEDGRAQREVGVNIDVTERKRAEQHQRALNAELDHRVKNVLATVNAIIAQTQQVSGSRADFVARLNSRVDALARTHELLSESNWRGASLVEIVRREFAPYATENVEVGGPSVTLKVAATQAVATVLHELTTNAAKYGAFSNRTGRVLVQWRWLQNGTHDRLVIEWQEVGGPPVLASSQFGYGTTIIRELIPFELGGAVELSFATEGTRCRLEIPGEWASKDRRTAEENRASD
jgi:PAS domain S-box-containing protein